MIFILFIALLLNLLTMFRKSNNGKENTDLFEFGSYCEKYGNFMQSPEWAQVKKYWKSEYIIVRNEFGEIIGSMLILVRKISLLNISFLYAPRSPVCDMHNKDLLNKIFSEIKKIADKHNAFAIKIDPLIDENDIQSVENLKALGFKHHYNRVGYDNIQCRENYMLDINGRTSDELMKSFKSKCRYNIRLAVRKGVQCNFYGEDKLDDFMLLMNETSRRDGFDMRNKDYFRRILKSFNGKAKLCMCYLGEIPLSGALCIEYAHTLSYVYGCSANKYRSFMPNYLMQWTMIKYACENSCYRYDFCGIPYWYDPTHKNYGVYKFKQNFNGYVKTYAGEFDYYFKPLISSIASKVWRLKKH